MNKVKEFEVDFLTIMEAKYKKVLDELRTGKLTDDITKTLETVAKEVAAKYKK
jgi:F-type H+-transporting ATPase subunit alpha